VEFPLFIYVLWTLLWNSHWSFLMLMNFPLASYRIVDTMSLGFPLNLAQKSLFSHVSHALLWFTSYCPWPTQIALGFFDGFPPPRHIDTEKTSCFSFTFGFLSLWYYHLSLTIIPMYLISIGWVCRLTNQTVLDSFLYVGRWFIVVWESLSCTTIT
jgi:hypothetical protein